MAAAYIFLFNRRWIETCMSILIANCAVRAFILPLQFFFYLRHIPSIMIVRCLIRQIALYAMRASHINHEHEHIPY